jgi:hypothetical protein
MDDDDDDHQEAEVLVIRLQRVWIRTAIRAERRVTYACEDRIYVEPSGGRSVLIMREYCVAYRK